MLATAVRDLKSPQNVGQIVRSHVAFGGGPLLFVGRDAPWRFTKNTQAFSRRLERLCNIVELENDVAFVTWCHENSCATVAVEIGPLATPVQDFVFGPRTVLVAGNESSGLPSSFLARCDHQVVIQQSGPVGSLNVAVACSIVLHQRAVQRCVSLPISVDEFLVHPSHDA
jgi:tRNA G18 (ribose-2'-O)-methylase SpoU